MENTEYQGGSDEIYGNRISEYKILELWPERIPGSKFDSLLARMTIINAISLQTIKQEFKVGTFSISEQGSIFVFPLNSKIATNFLSTPKEPKTLNLDDFFYGKLTMKGQVYDTYYHNSYIQENSKSWDNYFSANIDYDLGISSYSLNIRLKKENFHVTGGYKNNENTQDIVNKLFNTLTDYIKLLEFDQSKLYDMPNGILEAKVLLHKDLTKCFVARFKVYGFSISDIKDYIAQLEKL